jgi:hypothetical protein
MNDDTFTKNLNAALDTLKSEPPLDLDNFEHGVWSEIALRENSVPSSWRRWFQSATPLFPMPVTAAFATIAIIAGVSLGMSKADAYGKAAAETMEQNYVSSIHPVLKSQREP